MRKQGKTSGMPSMKGRFTALAAAGVLAASCMGAPVALATTNTPSAGEQSGTGATNVTIQLRQGADEVGGTEDSNNPDGNNDTYGDNIAFSVPTSINFIVNSDGSLSGPTNAAIQNHSKFAIHGSSLRVDAATGWNIVADASAESRTNAIDFQIGPENDMLDASAYLTKGSVTTPSEWNMTANTGTVALDTAGDVNNVATSITGQTRVATMHWYVTPGTAE